MSIVLLEYLTMYKLVQNILNVDVEYMSKLLHESLIQFA